MRFKFSIQPFQTDAVESVADVFAGQPYNDRFTYRRDVEVHRDIMNWSKSDEELTMGFANARVQIGEAQILANVRRIQMRNNIHVSDALTQTNLGACSLDVEMETGTGKTYGLHQDDVRAEQALRLEQVHRRGAVHRHPRGRAQEL